MIRFPARRVVLATACLLAIAPAAAQAAGTPARTKLADSTPSWAQPSAAVGSVANSDQKTFWVYLRLRDEQTLDQTISAVTDPASPSYGQYLTPDQFRTRFAPTEAQVAAVRAWLGSAGFAVSADAPANNRWIKASGSVAQIEQAFTTQLHVFRHRGRDLPAPSSDLSVPTSIAGQVAGIAGLDGSDRLIKPAGDIPGAPPSPAFVNAPPCSTSWAQQFAVDEKGNPIVPPAFGQPFLPYVTCGYTPSQLQGAYGTTQTVASGTNGRGQTVAIVDAFASPTIEQDADQYAALEGQPPVRFRQIVPPGIFDVPEDEPTNCDPQGWYGEETLDVEAVHAMAPGANVLYVGGQDCNDESLVDAVNKIVDGGLAHIITNSYGNAGEDTDAGLRQAWNDTFRQAALEGIGVYFSSGDSGDEVDDIGYPDADFPASHPLVTAVGGTSLGVSASNGYLFETGWGTDTATLVNGAWTSDSKPPVEPTPPGDHLYGSGGGTSLFYAQPDYQKKIVPRRIAKAQGGKPARVVPDISLVGDPNTGMLVGQTQTFPDGSAKFGTYRIGGTSLSSPLMAGMMALADQQAGRPHGFANPVLYAQYGTAALRDVVAPDQPIAVVRNDFVNGVDAADGISTKLRTFDQTESLHTTPGYDDVTGIGSPNGARFLAAIAGRNR